MQRYTMTPERRTEVADHFMHGGSGTGLVVANLGAIIPGFIPVLALTLVVAVVLALPILVLGLAAGLLSAPPYAAWRLVRAARRRVSREEPARSTSPQPAPHTGVCQEL
jgi:hypothetical protein